MQHDIVLNTNDGGTRVKTIPVDVSVVTLLAVAVLRAEERTDPDNPRSPMRPKTATDRKTGEVREVWRVQVLAKVEDADVEDDDELKGEIFDVVVHGPRPAVKPLDMVECEGLAARAWQMGDRSGISFSARSVVKAKAAPVANGRPAVPPVPASSTS